MRTYEGNEPYIFISYAHIDSAHVHSIISKLQEKGFRIWFDSGIQAGSEWPEYIAEHLQNSAVLLVFMTNAAANSRNCRDEINFAIDQNKDILVVYLEDTNLTAGMRLRLSATQAMFYNRFCTETAFIDELCAARILSSCNANSQTHSTFTPKNGIHQNFTTPSEQIDKDFSNQRICRVCGYVDENNDHSEKCPVCKVPWK